MNFEELAKKLESNFLPEAAKGIEAVIQLEIDGESVEYWLMEIRDSTCKIHPGVYESPRVTVNVSSKNLVKLLTGELDPMMAFFSGKVQVHGDRGFLMKIPSLFSTQNMEF
ncbi:hypothetical protein SDC9_62415 [bioreactor metagenome]|uniref:SCP2 domain-containing protein n=1 Tax=bioreactor metagenome TaxID=1076179 RepID=A0A644XJQ3_9ZZZZ